MDDKRDIEIVRLRQQGETCIQIGEKFGITDSRVSQIYRRWLMRQAASQNEGEAQKDNSLFYRMVELSDMKKTDGRPSHVPSAAYISICRYWETVHPGKLPTIEELCRMTEREVASIPSIGEALQVYIREFKQDAIRERVHRELRDVSAEGMITAVGGRPKGSILRTAVYIRADSGGTLSQSAARELLEADYRRWVERLPNCAVCGFYIDEEGKDDSSFRKLLSDCEQGKVDLIYTRSVMRFAESPDETSNIIERLKLLSPPVGILFFENGLYTLDSKSEELWKQFLDMTTEV